MTGDDSSEYATLTVTTQREIRVPLDTLGDDDPTDDEYRDRAEDWFWNFWREALANEPGPTKDDVSVEAAELPTEENQYAE